MQISFPIHIIFHILILTLLVDSWYEELQSLLEFQKGIKNPTSNSLYQTWTTATSADPNSCHSSWYGLTCDQSGHVISISLDNLGLHGDLKFSTLLGLTMLTKLTLSGNFFTGRIVPALGKMTSLQRLDLSGNQFYGPIPEKFYHLWGLNYLNLSSNKFEGIIPIGIQNLQQLKFLDLHSNEFWGDIAGFLSQLRNVEVVDLSYNAFSGSIDLDAANISGFANTVRRVDLGHNQIGGGFFKGDLRTMFQNLEELDLSNNLIVGELPSFMSFRSLKVLRLGNNGFGGWIPKDLFGSLLPLEELDLSDNRFTGWIPQINSTTLNVLNLSSCGLTGSLPSSLGNSKTVDLSKNQISGDMSILQQWKSTLEILDLSSNKLNGTFPNMISQLQNLSRIKIRNNSLKGNLPSAIGTYPKLFELDVSLNKLDGPIPHSLFTSLTLKNLNLSGNHLTGKISFEGSNSSELLVISSYLPLEYLDLSGNCIEGSLPSNIGNLEGLTLLNLARNSLSGYIPSEISQLSLLKYLDLSNNNFTGKIPDMFPDLTLFNVANNDLYGTVPKSLLKFPISSFRPGNTMLILPNDLRSSQIAHAAYRNGSSNARIKVAIIFATTGAFIMIVIVLFYHRAHFHEFHRSGLCGKGSGRDDDIGRFSRPPRFKYHTNVEVPVNSLNFSNDHLLLSNSRSLSRNHASEIIEPVPEKIIPGQPTTSGKKSSNSLVSSSPTLDVYSPDRLAGQLFFLDASLEFSAEQLSRAPAEVMGRSSHGTLYKATLDSGHILTVKWLRVGLVKKQKEFSNEAKRIGTIRHPNIVPLRAYYWGPREQERLILADYITGDSLVLHLYETTPRRYSTLSFPQRLKAAVDIAKGLLYLHEKGLPHGNLKPTNVLLNGPDLTACLTDFGLHRLMTQPGIAEQILNLGALGYLAPELIAMSNSVPSFKSDVYSLGVIVMELLTRRSAGDIISGQSGAVDLTDWVKMCDREGRGRDCIDRDITSGEEPSIPMYDLLAVSIRCVMPVNDRPGIRQVFEDLRSITV